MKKLLLTLSLSLSLCQAQAVETKPDRAPGLARALDATPSRELLESQGIHTTHARRMGEIQLDLDALGGDARARRAEGQRPRLAPGQWQALELFPGESVRVRGLRVERSDGGSETWVGEVEGTQPDASGHLLLSRRGEEIYGTAQFDLKHYRIESGRGGRVFVQELDPATYPGDGCGETEHADPTDHGLKGKGMAFATPEATVRKPDRLDDFGDESSPAGTKSAPLSHTVDVLFLYTSRVRNSRDPVLLADSLTAGMNQSFQSSGITAGVRSVGYVYAPVNEFNRTTQQLYTDMGSVSYSGFGNLSQLRSHFKADFVVLLFDLAASAQDACGFAQGPTELDQSGQNYFRGVVGASCSDGPAYTFAHEVGHLLGGAHNWGYSPFTTLPLIRSSYPYSTWDEATWQSYSQQHFRPTGHDKSDYGQWISAAGSNKGWRLPALGTQTLMSADHTCTMAGCPRLLRWSNPSQTYLGYPLGKAAPANCATTHSPDFNWSQCHADMRIVLNHYVPVASGHQVNNYPVPNQPASVTVSRGFCYGLNDVEWSSGGGVVGWYEGELQRQGTPWMSFYKGPESFFVLNVGSTTWIRMRACNSQGCSAWRNGDVTATYTNGCL